MNYGIRRKRTAVGTVPIVLGLLLVAALVLTGCEDPTGSNGNDNENGGNGDNGDNGDGPLSVIPAISFDVTITAELDTGSWDDYNVEYDGDHSETINSDVHLYSVLDLSGDADPLVSASFTESSFDVTLPRDRGEAVSFAELKDEFDLDIELSTDDVYVFSVRMEINDDAGGGDEWLLKYGKVNDEEPPSELTFHEYWWVDREVTITGTIEQRPLFGQLHFGENGAGIELQTGWNEVRAVWVIENNLEDDVVTLESVGEIEDALWIAVVDYVQAMDDETNGED